MVITPPATNTGPVYNTIVNVHATAKDTLAYHDGRPDLFELVTIETVENQEDTAKEYQEHATAADEQDQLPDNQKDVELWKPSNKNISCLFG